MLDELSKIDGFLYLASPYSSEDHRTVEYRATEAERAVAFLTLHNVVVFGAIHHSHSLVKYGMQNNWQTWRRIDEIFLHKSEGIIVLKLPGWDKSTGVLAEIDFCLRHNKPIYEMKKEGLFNYSFSKTS